MMDEDQEQAVSKLNLESMTALDLPTDGLIRVDRLRIPRRYPFGPFRDGRLVPEAVREKITLVLDGLSPWPLVFLGKAGVGKTCAALSVIDWIVPAAKYWTIADLCALLVSVQNGEVEYGTCHDTLAAWWKRYECRGCVVLDELVSRDKVSDFAYESVKRAIDLRYNRPLVVVSNGTLGTISRIYDDRIASRLSAGTVVDFVGVDRRLADHERSAANVQG